MAERRIDKLLKSVADGDVEMVVVANTCRQPSSMLHIVLPSDPFSSDAHSSFDHPYSYHDIYYVFIANKNEVLLEWLSVVLC